MGLKMGEYYQVEIEVKEPLQEVELKHSVDVRDKESKLTSGKHCEYDNGRVGVVDEM